MTMDEDIAARPAMAERPRAWLGCQSSWGCVWRLRSIAIMVAPIVLWVNAAQAMRTRPIVEEALWQDADGQWFLATTQRAKARLILIHGINGKPAGFDIMAQALADRGFHVLRIALRGHRSIDTIDAFRQVSASLWLAQLSAAVSESERRFGDLPLVCVGHSLGGLLATHVASWPSAKVQGLFLLAPALKIHPYLQSARAMFFMPSFVLPSASESAYRAHSGTPMAAYRALFELMGDLTPLAYRLNEIPAAIAIDPGDELVSPKGLRRFVDEEALGGWRMYTIKKSQPFPAKILKHLMQDPQSLGDKAWEDLLQLMEERLNLALQDVVVGRRQ